MMIAELKNIERKLRIIAKKLTNDKVLREDLVQEMLIRYIEIRKSHPNEKESWYLQGCKYRAINFLRHGKSIDSKRRNGLAKVSYDRDESSDSLSLVDEHDLEVHLATEDFFRKLRDMLTKKQKYVLRLLRKGYSNSEISRLLEKDPSTIRETTSLIIRKARKLLDNQISVRVAQEAVNNNNNGDNQIHHDKMR